MLGDLTLFDNPRNIESQCYGCIFIQKRILSYKLKSLTTIKIILLSPELIALPLIAPGLLDARDFITFPFYFIVI